MKKRWFSVFSLLLVLIISFSLTGCNTKEGKKESVEVSKNKVIIDSTGREVTVPTKVEKVIGLNNGLRFLCYLDCVDKVCGVEEGEKKKGPIIKAYNYVYYDTWKDKPIVGKGGSGGYTPYDEEIIKVKPDVIICCYDKKDAQTLQDKTGIPVVVVHDGNIYSKEYNDSLRLIGDIMGVTNRANELISYIDNTKNILQERVKNVKDEDKKSVFVGAVSFRGGHGIEGTYSDFPIFSILGAKDVCKNLTNKSAPVIIDKEKILEYNPDIIFLDPNNRSYVEKDYAENPNYYKQLKAFNEKNIYNCPGYIFYHSNIELAVADTFYLASIIYPEQFKDMDARKKAKETFKVFLHNENYYDELEKAGKGFGKFNI